MIKLTGKDESNRVKLLLVNKQMMVNLLCSMQTQKRVPWTEDLPKDGSVVNVHYESAFDQFAFIISSETFPEVKTGAMLEAITPTYKWVKVLIDDALRS